ncbi:MAG: hypothetical protein RBU37_19115, partial [Myxococcota bacterium]|nr:hypothetical protein [Myxococcota bacterium]
MTGYTSAAAVGACVVPGSTDEDASMTPLSSIDATLRKRARAMRTLFEAPRGSLYLVEEGETSALYRVILAQEDVAIEALRAALQRRIERPLASCHQAIIDPDKLLDLEGLPVLRYPVQGDTSTLAQCVRDHSPLPLRKWLGLLVPPCAALASIHKEQRTHGAICAASCVVEVLEAQRFVRLIDADLCEALQELSCREVLGAGPSAQATAKPGPAGDVRAFGQLLAWLCTRVTEQARDAGREEKWPTKLEALIRRCTRRHPIKSSTVANDLARIVADWDELQEPPNDLPAALDAESGAMRGRLPPPPAPESTGMDGWSVVMQAIDKVGEQAKGPMDNKGEQAECPMDKKMRPNEARVDAIATPKMDGWSAVFTAIQGDDAGALEALQPSTDAPLDESADTLLDLAHSTEQATRPPQDTRSTAPATPKVEHAATAKDRKDTEAQPVSPLGDDEGTSSTEDEDDELAAAAPAGDDELRKEADLGTEDTEPLISDAPSKDHAPQAESASAGNAVHESEQGTLPQSSPGVDATDGASVPRRSDRLHALPKPDQLEEEETQPQLSAAAADESEANVDDTRVLDEAELDELQSPDDEAEEPVEGEEGVGEEAAAASPDNAPPPPPPTDRPLGPDDSTCPLRYSVDELFDPERLVPKGSVVVQTHRLLPDRHQDVKDDEPTSALHRMAVVVVLVVIVLLIILLVLLATSSPQKPSEPGPVDAPRVGIPHQMPAPHRAWAVSADGEALAICTSHLVQVESLVDAGTILSQLALSGIGCTALTWLEQRRQLAITDQEGKRWRFDYSSASPTLVAFDAPAPTSSDTALRCTSRFPRLSASVDQGRLSVQGTEDWTVESTVAVDACLLRSLHSVIGLSQGRVFSWSPSMSAPELLFDATHLGGVSALDASVASPYLVLAAPARAFVLDLRAPKVVIEAELDDFDPARGDQLLATARPERVVLVRGTTARLHDLLDAHAIDTPVAMHVRALGFDAEAKLLYAGFAAPADSAWAPDQASGLFLAWQLAELKTLWAQPVEGEAAALFPSPVTSSLLAVSRTPTRRQLWFGSADAGLSPIAELDSEPLDASWGLDGKQALLRLQRGSVLLSGLGTAHVDRRELSEPAAMFREQGLLLYGAEGLVLERLEDGRRSVPLLSATDLDPSPVRIEGLSTHPYSSSVVLFGPDGAWVFDLGSFELIALEDKPIDHIVWSADGGFFSTGLASYSSSTW